MGWKMKEQGRCVGLVVDVRYFDFVCWGCLYGVVQLGIMVVVLVLEGGDGIGKFGIVVVIVYQVVQVVVFVGEQIGVDFVFGGEVCV